MKKRILTMFLTATVAFCSIGCGTGGGNASVSSPNSSGDGQSAPEYLVGSTLQKTDGGRVYLSVQDSPFLYTGVQVRADGYTQLDKHSLEEMEEQFRLASETGVNCIEVPISWNELEPEEDVYNFRKFKTYLEWCLKYDLKLEVLWFAYNNGHALEMYTPSYIFDDETRFPQHPSDVKGETWGEQGRVTFFKLNAPELLARERKAIAQLTDFIYEWEMQNGNPNIVISYQVHNEVDNYPRWNIENRNVLEMDGSAKLNPATAWQEIYDSLDSAGKAFKSSKYRAVTRTNLVTLRVTEEWKDFAVKIFNLEGIDIVGDDTYTNSVEEQKASMDALLSDYFGKNNLAHVAENSGSFSNSPTLILSAVTQGCGYLMYCLSLPLFWIKNESNWDWWEQGVLDVEWNDKEHTQRVRDIFYGLKAAAQPLASCEISQMAAFNADTDNPVDEHSQSYTFNGIKFTVSTASGALGYCLYYDNAVYVFADKEVSLRFDEAEISACYGGKFSGTRFLTQSSVTYDGKKVDLSGNNLYKIEIL